MDDVGGGEVVGFGDLGGAGAAAMEFAAFAHEGGAGCGVDGAILGGEVSRCLCALEEGLWMGKTYNTTTTEQRFVGCVDDARCCERCDGAFEKGDLGVQAGGRSEVGVWRG